MGFKSPVEIPDIKLKKPPSEANSGAGDRPGEGRLGENRELMNKNRIEGRHGAMSWHNTTTASAAIAAPEKGEATPQSVPKGG